jgi:hypothetical protein
MSTGLKEGIRLKAEGQAAAESGASEWSAQATEIIVELAEAGVHFTSEDITDRIGLPSGSTGMNENNAVGSVFSKACRKGLIEWTGELKQSSREERHASDLRVWRKSDPSNPYIRVEADTLRRLAALANRGLNDLIANGDPDPEFVTDTNKMIEDSRALLAKCYI